MNKTDLFLNIFVLIVTNDTTFTLEAFPYQL